MPIPGLGWPSPAILGDRIWLTTATDRGRSLQALCLDRATGRQTVTVDVLRSEGEETINGKNSYASPTPLLDGDLVYTHFGPYGTACIRNSGEVVWRTRLKYSPQHGPGGSPVLFEDLLIVSCDGLDTQYVAALDTRTGKIRWKTRARKSAYVTPLVIEAGGRTQLMRPVPFAPPPTIRAPVKRFGGYATDKAFPMFRGRCLARAWFSSVPDFSNRFCSRSGRMARKM